MEAGLRVVRGPDWTWGGQDGGEGNVGTIMNPGGSQKGVVFNGCVFVIWDGGQVANYRAGHSNLYDLYIFDTSLIGSRHLGVKCDACGKCDLIGIRWSCKDCRSYNLCNGCYTSDRHDTAHLFLRYDLPSSTGALVPPRSKSKKMEAMGIYPGATVVRGPDWRWNDQDGGEGRPGLVCDVTDKSDAPVFQSWCRVTWEQAGSNEYRRGHEGTLDVCCIFPSSGGYYYPTHLARVGKDMKESEQAGSSREVACGTSPESDVIGVGDKVTICLEPDIFKALQDSHGGWNDAMSQCIGSMGQVLAKMDNGDFVVQFNNFKKPWRINPVALSKQMNLSELRVNDIVKISNDEEFVSKLQVGHGGWTPAMKLGLGGIGKVTNVFPTGDVRVRMKGRGWVWTFNPQCCTPVKKPKRGSDTSDSGSDSEQESGIDGNLMQHMAMMHEAVMNPDNLVAAAANGVIPHVIEILSKFPTMVDVRNNGKTALQMACLAGHTKVIEILLNAGADMLARDDDGDMPVHFAVIENKPESLEMLISHGADVSVVNNHLLSPLHLSVRKGYRDCVKILLRNRCNSNLTDNSGDTALHDAIGSNSNELVELLVNAADFDFFGTNERGFNVLHQAALSGNSRAAVLILEKAPKLINVKKDDGMTPLHIAVLHGHQSLTEALLATRGVDLNAQNICGHTPLHVALLHNQMLMAELLVTKGANVNSCDSDGNSPLHVVLERLKLEMINASKEESALLSSCPVMTELKSLLPSDLKQYHRLPVALLLTRYGADLHRVNRAGTSPMDFVQNSEAIVSVLQKEASRSDLTECLMCSDSPVEVTFQPCGHRIVCRACAKKMKKCFTCKTTIEQPQQADTITTICTRCLKNDRNVVFLCGHGSCKECQKKMESCHHCGQSTQNCVTLF